MFGSMIALEFGAGTGILSFLLKDRFSEITLMDNSSEMIKVCEEKVEYYAANHIKPLFFDLEHSDYNKKIEFKTCFEMKRDSGKIFPVFLLVTKK